MGVYERFFKLHDEPFRLTPDPRYLFPSGKHREVLAHLRLGITESGGFVCITGDVGTGKTTLVRAFLDQLDSSTPYAYLFNPPQSSLELLQTISAEFGLPATATSRKILMDDLNAFLLGQRRVGNRPLIIADEAQALAPEVLEELRLLSNLETATAKLLQIVLFGQPQLADLLQSADLAQLNQRITLRWHLGPLDGQETAAYIRHRLRVAAGGVDRSLFSGRALGRIHRYTGGIPRLINMFAHRCLLAAFAEERRVVTARTVERVHEEIQRIPLLGPRPQAPRRFARGVAWGAGAAAVAAAIGWLALRTDVIGAIGARFTRDPAPVARSAGATASAADGASAGATAASERPAARLGMLTARSPKEVPVAQGDSFGGARFGAPGNASGDVPNGIPEGMPSGILRGTPTRTGDPDAAATGAARAALTVHATGDGSMRPLGMREATRMLLDAGEDTSIVAALEATLERWGEPPLLPSEMNVPIDLEDVAARRGLEYLSVSGTMNMLRVLNLPAILEVMLPDADGPRYALLEGIGTDAYVLGLTRGSFPVEHGFVDTYWMGQAHIVWRDFEQLAPILRRGSSGPRVARLQEILADLGFYDGPINSVFGTETEGAVVAFQRSRRLFADALVGQLTRIALYDALGGYPHPRLIADEPGAAAGAGTETGVKAGAEAGAGT